MLGTQMDRTKLQALANELAKDIKTEADLNALSRELLKLTVETALSAELTEHLGYEKHGDSRPAKGNTRNGTTSKRLKSQHGDVEIETPRDRDGTFEPQLLRKNQTRLTQMDDQILTLYAKGLTTREIVDTFKEMYDADVSATLISKVTDRVLEQVTAWQSRPLDTVYPIMYLDCIVLKIREGMRVVNKAIYLALGVNMDGHKELLGLWMSENEGAKFWVSVLTELKNRGVKDILIACVDGLKGFPDAIAVEYPQTRIQLCLVHMVRNSLKYVSWKDYKAVTRDLKQIYHATTEDQALVELDRFGKTWDSQYPQITKSWTTHWVNLRTLFEFPSEIRKAIYTTNAVESLNSVIRAVTKRRKVFPTDESSRRLSTWLSRKHQRNGQCRSEIGEWRCAGLRLNLVNGLLTTND